MYRKRPIDAVNLYMTELRSRVVAASGRPEDRYHLGKIILQSFRDDPDFVLQIDGATGALETCGSLLERTTRLARCFRAQGLGVGDVVVLMAPNHLDVTVPFYAALYEGMLVAAVDRTLGIEELESSFSVNQPKVIFCQSDRAPDIQVVLNNLDLDAKIVTFDGGDYLTSFQEYLDLCPLESPDDFKCADLESDEAPCFLIATSGTTGLPKSAVVTNKNFCISIPYVWTQFTKFPTPTRLALVGSPLQWLSAQITFLASALFRFTRLQTSKMLTKQHCLELMDIYAPSWALLSPTFLTSLMMTNGDGRTCDLSCFEVILIGGSAVPPDLIDDIQAMSPSTLAYNIYGMTELAGLGFVAHEGQPSNSCGLPMGCLNYRLIDVSTGEDIHGPNSPGELWLQGPTVFKNYYRNPKGTDETFAEGRWFKTGDLLYRDQNDYFHYVDRIKLLLKYKSYQISPVELEDVIRRHPGVHDVAVTSLPDPECGDLPVACVVRTHSTSVTAQEIKDLVKDTLSDSKQLRGGVVFMDKIPVTATTKVHRRQLKEMALTMARE